MDELSALVARLVGIDSVNPSLVDGGAGEAEIAAFVSSSRSTPRWACRTCLTRASRRTRRSSPSPRTNRWSSPTRGSCGRSSASAGPRRTARGRRTAWTRSPRRDRRWCGSARWIRPWAELTGLLAGLDASARTLLVREPFAVDPDAEIVRLVCSLTGASTSGAPYWTDAAFLGTAGIPTLLYGPSGAGAHADEEWVSLRSTAGVANTLLSVASEFCQ